MAGQRKVSKDDGPVMKKRRFEGNDKISQLYQIIIIDGSEFDSDVLFKVVWPKLQKSSTEANPTTNKEWIQACHLFSFLVTNQEGYFTLTPFIDDAGTLELVVRTILQESSDDNPYIIHLMIALLESEITRKIVLSYLGESILHFIPKRRLQLEIKKSSSLRRSFSLAGAKPDKLWVMEWIQKLLEYIEGNTKFGNIFRNDDQIPESVTEFFHRSLELLIDFLSAFDSRQFLILYLDVIHFHVRCHVSLQGMAQSRHPLTQQLLRRVFTLLDFPVRSDKTSLTKEQSVATYHTRAAIVQKLCHRYYKDDLTELIYAGVGILCNGKYLTNALLGLEDEKLVDLLYRLRLIEEKDANYDRRFLMAVLRRHLTPPSYPLDDLKSFPLYPTETILFDHNVIPPGNYQGKTQVLSIPKLCLQFLSYQDYLLRNFELIRLESAYEIRSDLVDVIKRVKPKVRQVMKENSNELVLTTDFSGWARMAIELQEAIRILRIAPPKLGDSFPAKVVAEIIVDLVHCGDAIRKEWDSLSEFDNLFLVAIDATQMSGTSSATVALIQGEDNGHPIPDDEDTSFPQRYGVSTIRGCMVLNIRDEDGNILNDPTIQQEKTNVQATKRYLRVELDPVQYAHDMKSKKGTDIYGTFNLLVRREGRANNFKAVLETIRGLMEGSGSIERVLPSWLQPVILGYGDPKAANYKSPAIKAYSLKTPGVPKLDSPLDFQDTFLDSAHLMESFSEDTVHLTESIDGATRKNLKLEFHGDVVNASPYDFVNKVKGNTVRFTPVQVEAIKSGMSLGMTLVVGPPGTGKSDVAVQIIANLYHSFPTQRTVIITHSNAALNDLFQKIIAREDIDERYMIRLGAGERDLDVTSTHDFSRIGRVSHSLSRRSHSLEQVQQLSESLGISSQAERGADGSPSYTCESAAYLYRVHIKKRIETCKAAMNQGVTNIGSKFPFALYFGLSDEHITQMTLTDVQSKLDTVTKIFEELEEYHPLELLKSHRHRVDYILMKQARIVAMTCTHAAIARTRLIEMGFQYDNAIMEEAGQMTEVESFIPLLLQRGETDLAMNCSRLKRITLIGDHNQLPPVVKNLSFARFSKLDRSLFARLISFGVPHIQLDRQGRTRPEIANLFRWRYKNLGDLQHVLECQEYKTGNAGFEHTFQFIDVPDYLGKGETTPTAYFYQNLGEAEYAVALFQFMILIGYDPGRITILSAYNGQKELILDILKQRCGVGTTFSGLSPRAVSTVDQYQGQQNDMIILSLVRTKSVGYLRDVRRCVVAFSRARLGLYVVGRKSLFVDSCPNELEPMMQCFQTKPYKLKIIPGEHWPTNRLVNDATIPANKSFEIKDVSHLGSIVHDMQKDWLQGE